MLFHTLMFRSGPKIFFQACLHMTRWCHGSMNSPILEKPWASNKDHMHAVAPAAFQASLHWLLGIGEAGTANSALGSPGRSSLHRWLHQAWRKQGDMPQWLGQRVVLSGPHGRHRPPKKQLKVVVVLINVSPAAPHTEQCKVVWQHFRIIISAQEEKKNRSSAWHILVFALWKHSFSHFAPLMTIQEEA